MIARIKRLWSANPILLIAFTGALLAFGFFGVQTAAKAIYWWDPAHRDQPLEGWMTPRYVSHSYGIPPELLFPVFGLKHEPRGDDEARSKGRMTLTSIAAANDVTLADLQVRVNELAEQVRLDKESD